MKKLLFNNFESFMESSIYDSSKNDKTTPHVKSIVMIYSNRYNSPPPLIPHLFVSNRSERIYNQIKLNKVNIIQYSVNQMASEDDLLLVHTPIYLSKMNGKTISEIYEYPNLMTPFTQKYIDDNFISPIRWQIAGTCNAVEKALNNGASINIGGGFIHPRRNKSLNRQLFSDIGIAIEKHCKNIKVLIINLDANQADGLYEYIQNKSNIYLFDMYNKNIIPAINKNNRIKLVTDIKKTTNILHVPLDGGNLNHTFFGQNKFFNVKVNMLDPWNFTRKIHNRKICNHEYMRNLQKLPDFMDKIKPDIVIYHSGSDIYNEDPKGCMNVTKEGFIIRDLFVWQNCITRKIPICMIISEGFAPDIAEVIGESIENICNNYTNFINNTNLESYNNRLQQLI